MSEKGQGQGSPPGGGSGSMVAMSAGGSPEKGQAAAGGGAVAGATNGGTGTGTTTSAASPSGVVIPPPGPGEAGGKTIETRSGTMTRSPDGTVTFKGKTGGSWQYETKTRTWKDTSQGMPSRPIDPDVTPEMLDWGANEWTAYANELQRRSMPRLELPFGGTLERNQFGPRDTYTDPDGGKSSWDPQTQSWKPIDEGAQPPPRGITNETLDWDQGQWNDYADRVDQWTEPWRRAEQPTSTAVGEAAEWFVPPPSGGAKPTRGFFSEMGGKLESWARGQAAHAPRRPGK
jgi:hypothetical protein